MQKATLSALPEGFSDKGTFVQDIMFRNPKSGHEFHLFLAIDTSGYIRVFHAFRRGKSKTTQLKISSRNYKCTYFQDYEGYSYLLKVKINTIVRRAVRCVVNSGFSEFVYHEIDSEFDPSNKEIPEFLRSYFAGMLETGVFVEGAETGLCGGVATLVDASTLTGKPLRRRFCEIPSVQNWLQRYHPRLTSLPEWKIPLAIRI